MDIIFNPSFFDCKKQKEGYCYLSCYFFNFLNPVVEVKKDHLKPIKMN